MTRYMHRTVLMTPAESGWEAVLTERDAERVEPVVAWLICEEILHDEIGNVADDSPASQRSRRGCALVVSGDAAMCLGDLNAVHKAVLVTFRPPTGSARH